MMHKSSPIDRVLLALLVFISLPIQSSLSASSASINAIRVGDYVHYTQIAVEMNGSQIPCSAVPFSHNPPILVLKFRGLTAGAIGRTFSADSVSFKKISVSQNPGELWMTIPVSSNVDLNNISCISGDGAVLINLHFKRPNYSKIPSPEKIAEFRKNGGKVVVIDPGHGGHDTGTAGVYTNPPHLVEKDVVLEIGKKLKRLVDSHPQMMGILIRDGDYYPMPPDVPFSTSLAFRSKALDYRVNLAKEYKGDIYVSLHLNAPAYRKYHKTVRGYEIYIFDETAATTLAEEWRSSEFDAADSVTIKDAIGSKVLMDMILNSSQLSKELATSITHEVDRIPEMVIRPNPIKASPKFKVLKHLNMPSVLIEYIFLTHPIEHEYVRKDRNKETLAHATYEGIRKYFFEREQVIAMTSRPLTTNSNKVVSNPVESEIDAILAQIPKVTPTAPKIETSTVASSARSNPSAPKSTAAQTKTTQTPTKPIQAPPTNPVYHTIRTGETVGSIAQTYGIKVEDLRQANKTTIGRRDRINVGQKLVIPGSIQIAGTSASVKKNAPAQHIVVHKVKRGESLDKIAIKYNTTIASIKSLNRLRTSTIHPGNELKIIPGMTKANNQVSSAKPIRYTVRSGDTLSDISKEFGISTSTIMQTNSLQSSRLVAGQVLQIPVF